MPSLKPLSQEAIPAALKKAHRYRLLNEPGEAESICLDILQVDPSNKQALVTLFLAMTDRFGKGYAVSEAQCREVLDQITDPYERRYYEGIYHERRAKALLHQGAPGCGSDAYESFTKAMHCFEEAESLREPGNDDPILRWNACVRMIQSNQLKPRQADHLEPFLE